MNKAKKLPNLRFEKSNIEYDLYGNKIVRLINTDAGHGHSKYCYNLKDGYLTLKFYSLKEVNRYYHLQILKYKGRS